MKPTVTQAESVDILSKKGTCIEFFSAYQDFDLNRMLGLCNPAGEVFFTPLGEAGKGKIYETGKTIWEAVLDSFPDLDNTVHAQTYNQADNSITCTVAIFGKQQKEFAGIPTKGLRFDNEHIFIFRFDDKGKIDNISINWDHESFVKQLGKS